ncbi:MAG: isopentenyl-diphosphate Delta-isomerase [Gemmatimonadales bacterium]
MPKHPWRKGHVVAPEELVVLVDERDRERGSSPKLAAHVVGELHRAFSVFVFDPQGRLLLQRRALGKYHSAGLWSNTCCGHPRPGEPVAKAAHRRLREEMGIDCLLRPAFDFIYRAELENGLIEHEYDHVFVGRFAGVPAPNPDEVAEWRWASVSAVTAELESEPARYTAWLRIALDGLTERGLVPAGGAQPPARQ